MEIEAKFFELACAKAWEYQGLTYPNPAVGAVVVKNGLAISCEAHKEAGLPHAEVDALKFAFFILSDDTVKKEDLSKLQTSHEIHHFLTENAVGLFSECDIYVTLEPCAHEGRTPSCAKLLGALKPRRVIIGAREKNKEASGGCEILESCGVEAFFVESEPCTELIEPFFRWKNEGGFVFFKLALTMNGRIGGGKISCDASFELVHRLRNKIELLAIGGNTVRVDKPTLDARLVGGRAPDVLIYSKTDNFVMDMPLFAVKNRKIIISNTLNVLKDYKFVMIEGGNGMLSATLDTLDYFLFFVSPQMSGCSELNALDLSFKILHSRRIDKDLLIWAKRSRK